LGKPRTQLLYGKEDAEGRWTLGLFDLLKGAGILANYEKPLDIDEGDRGKGWVERWLALEVRWTTTEAAKQIEQATLDKAKTEAGKAKPRRRNKAAKPPRKPLTKAQRLDAQTAADIRAKCARLNWNRDSAARHFGVAGTTLSNVLNYATPPARTGRTSCKTFSTITPNPSKGTAPKRPRPWFTLTWTPARTRWRGACSTP
jgi:hypothetical protein